MPTTKAVIRRRRERTFTLHLPVVDPFQDVSSVLRWNTEQLHHALCLLQFHTVHQGARRRLHNKTDVTTTAAAAAITTTVTSDSLLLVLFDCSIREQPVYSFKQ